MLRTSLILFYAATLLVFQSWNVIAGESLNLDIKTKLHPGKMPVAEASNQKIYVAFEGSPKMARIIQEKLKARGFAVVTDPLEADTKYVFKGGFSIEGKGKESINGQLGDLLEKTVSIETPTSPDYTHQTINLTQIAASTAFLGGISVTDMIQWIGQKSGIAGRFNEMLTGDPRGFCVHENCNKFLSRAVMWVRGDTGYWWVEGSVWNERMVLDLVIVDTLEKLLAPIYDLKPQKNTEAM